MRLLLIEDEPSAVDLTKHLLGQYASKIDDAPTLDGAYELLSKNVYDIVILDLQLIGSSRDETKQAIPRVKRMANAPVIVATGWPDPNLREECLALGADAFVEKREVREGMVRSIQAALIHAPPKEREPSFFAHVALMGQMIQAR